MSTSPDQPVTAEQVAEHILAMTPRGEVRFDVEPLWRLAYEYRQLRFRVAELELELDQRGGVAG